MKLKYEVQGRPRKRKQLYIIVSYYVLYTWREGVWWGVTRDAPRHVVHCSSSRKFRRLLRKWSVYLPAGTVFFLYTGNGKIIGKTI